MEKIKMKKILSTTLLCLAASTSAFAKPPHAMMTLITQSDQWDVTPAMINEGGVFFDNKGNKINPGVSINLKFSVSPYKLGWQYSNDDDFNVAYTIAARTRMGIHHFSAKSCVFLVTAKGPGNPQVSVNNYNGAQCYYVDNGVGGEFYFK